MDGLKLEKFDVVARKSEKIVKDLLDLAVKYDKAVVEEDGIPTEKLAVVNVGRQDVKKHLEKNVQELMSSNIVATLTTMLDVVVF